MGCFLACFGTKGRKRQKPTIKSPPRIRSQGSYGSLPQTSSPKQLETGREIDSVPLSRVNSEELSLSSRKKVTFDLNVKSYPKVSGDEDLSSLPEKDQKNQSGHEVPSENTDQSITSSGDSSTTTTTDSSYPPRHRYQNCRCSDDEEDEDDGYENEEEEDDYDEDDDGSFESEESFESCYSPVGTESRISRAQKGEQEIDNNKPICDSPVDHKSMLPLSRNARDRSQYVHSVLNPVENLSQWKALKHKDSERIPLKQHRKENSAYEQEMQIPLSSEPTFKFPKPETPINSVPNFKLPKQDKKPQISVDASLSNWLIPSEAAPMSTSVESKLDFGGMEKYQSVPARTISPRNQDDRPILGALTVEEIRMASPRPSPSRSPSPDEIPILGTVGTYWNHSNQAMDSSPKRTRLEINGIPNLPGNIQRWRK